MSPAPSIATATKVVYISGPMTGLPEFNYPAFNAAEERLSGLGHRVLNPARYPDGKTWEEYMRLALVDLSESTHIYRLPGWEESRGAVLENDIAQRLGIEVLEEPEPWQQIGVGIDNAGWWIVDGVPGIYWRLAVVRGEWEVWQMPPDGAKKMQPHHIPASDITSVEPVQVVPEGARVLGEDEVAVPRESLGVLRRAKHATRLGPDQGWLATALDDLYDDLPGDLAAVEGGGDQ